MYTDHVPRLSKPIDLRHRELRYHAIPVSLRILLSAVYSYCDITIPRAARARPLLGYHYCSNHRLPPTFKQLMRFTYLFARNCTRTSLWWIKLLILVLPKFVSRANCIITLVQVVGHAKHDERWSMVWGISHKLTVSHSVDYIDNRAGWPSLPSF